MWSRTRSAAVGGTGGLSAYCAFVPRLAGTGVLTNVRGWRAIDVSATRHLTRLVN